MSQVSISTRVVEFIKLMKPRIIVLLATTGVVPYMLAGARDPLLIFTFLVIGFLSAGGAMALNSVIDRDIDHLMERTKKRASVTNLFSPTQILTGSILSMTSATILAFFVFNPLAAFWVAFGELFYIFGYSLYLKRKNVYNTLIGGLASPAPVLVGYSAALGEIPTFGWIVAGLVFIWTPSHTWALSTYYMDDYSRAGVPMLPVVYGIDFTAKATLAFMVLTSAYSAWIVFFDGISIALIILWSLSNSIFLFQGWKFLRTKDKMVAYRLFKMHNYWLAFQFLLLFL